MNVPEILRSAPEDEAVEALRKINELLWLIAANMAASPGPPPVAERERTGH